MIDRFEKFSFAIFEISRHWHKITADEMEKYGLKGPHAIYLTIMLRYPDGITAANLSEVCGKDKADVSRAMSLMEKKGLIMREDVNKNRYRALLKLTETGKTAAAHVSQRAMLAVEIAGRDLTDENRAVFYKSLELIASNLREISEEGLPQK